MSFGRELKDFAEGFKTVKTAQEDEARTDYFKAETEKMKKGPSSGEGDDATFDLNGAMSGDPGNESIDTAAPHGKLYNLGKWLGLTGNPTAPPNAAGPTSPTAAVARSTALPVAGLDASNTTPFDPDQTAQGYARGGLVAAKNPGVYDDGAPEVMDDGGPEAGTGALPTEAITVSAPRNATGVLRAKADPATYDDGGPNAGTGALPTEAISVSANRPVPRPTPRPDDPEPTTSEAITAGPDTPTPQQPDQQNVTPVSDEAIASAADSGVGDLGAALHGGIMALQSHFRLDPRAGAVPDQQSVQAGQKALFSSDGRASPSEMQAVAAAVDPKGELTHSQMLLRAMTKGYEFYLNHGQPQHAANYAASIIQYATFEASKHGDDAINALKKGDINSAAQSLKAGYDNIPDGREATNVKVNPDKTVSVTETDVKTGKPINQHTLSGPELYQAALGLKNKTISWQALMTAAGGAKGANLPESDAYNAAEMKLAGANPDGTLTDAGNSQAIPTQPTQQGDQLITRADPNAMHMVESNNNPGAISPKGASGVGQTMPGTLQSPGFGVAPAKDDSPQEKQRVADEYLQAMVKNFGPVYGHIAYNWGPQAMQNWKAQGSDFRKLPVETQQYLGRIAVAQQKQQQGGDQPAGMQPAAYTTQAPQSQPAPQGATLTGPLTLKPGDQKYTGGAQPGQPAQPQSPLALRPALPEDQQVKPELPPEPTMAQLPERPTPPKQVSMADFPTANMQPKERLSIQKQIVAQNVAARQKFNEDMRLWTSQQSEARTNFNAEHTKYADAVRAAKQPTKKDPFPLPVKDRGDATKALQEVRPDPKDQNDPVAKAFGSFQPTSQKAVDNVAYAFYTSNNMPPQKAYQAAINMMLPQSVNFQPHEMPDGNTVRIVFKDGSKFVLPKNAFDEMAAARGNEHYVMRTGGAAKAAGDAKDAALGKQRKSALNKAFIEPDRTKMKPGETLGGDAMDNLKGAGRAVVGAAQAIPTAFKPRTVDPDLPYSTNN